MARSIEDIMNSLLEAKAAQPGLSSLSSNSVTAIWRLLLYVVAVGCYVLEQLLDEHINEVEEKLSQKIPHRAKWYCDMTLKFMENHSLVADQDYYNLSNLADEEITKERIIKHAVAVEDGKNAMLTIKVAGEFVQGERNAITEEQLRQLGAYLGEIKDAGVRINIVNREADLFNVRIDIYYDAMREGAHIKSACEDVINDYIKNLPFNGEYTNMALVDRVQNVSGVKVVELIGASAREHGVEAITIINARYTPVAGYLKSDIINLNMIAYER